LRQNGDDYGRRGKTLPRLRAAYYRIETDRNG
jgi:hypothetical protein